MKIGLPRHLRGVDHHPHRLPGISTVFTTTPTVSPAKAGAQEIFSPQPTLASPEGSWIPDSAGMTM